MAGFGGVLDKTRSRVNGSTASHTIPIHFLLLRSSFCGVAPMAPYEKQAAEHRSSSVSSWWKIIHLYTDQTGSNITRAVQFGKEKNDRLLSHGADVEPLANAWDAGQDPYFPVEIADLCEGITSNSISSEHGCEDYNHVDAGEEVEYPNNGEDNVAEDYKAAEDDDRTYHGEDMLQHET
ncbi:hypothetical protein L2E82_41378 [Cichorium intybus]|uniref:Uncharacterized protein n=1 Tax=Cichorium intybus TaxID=13427 RepID=A0ACB9AM92_CICIN|nr:hypothetical protein L2E82_41378 [Cichorium intybus]